MKNVCLLTTKYPAATDSPWLTNELANSLSEDGFNVTVIALSWLPDDPESSVQIVNGIKEIRIKVPQFLYKKNIIFTALKLFVFPLYTILTARKHIRSCDALITNTPCITMLGSAPLFKRFYDAKTFLILWDFFPFYLKDLGAVRGPLFFKALHQIEARMYKTFDAIGCMTPKNSDFLIEKYDYNTPKRIHKLSIWTKVQPLLKSNTSLTRASFNLPENKVIAVYGGAISVVQELDNLLNLISESRDLPVHFLIIGNGTDYDRIHNKANSMPYKNFSFLPPVSRSEYNRLLSVCDIGLIFLSHKLSVPSFPSKSLDYFRSSIPIIAGIDNFTDFGEILESEIKAGFAETANETNKLLDHLRILAEDSCLRRELGINGRQYYEKNFDVTVAKKAIINALMNTERNHYV